MTYSVYSTKRMFVEMCYCKFHRKCFHLLLSFFFSPTVLVIQKAYHQNASDFHYEGQQWQARIDVGSSNFEEKWFVLISVLTVQPFVT